MIASGKDENVPENWEMILSKSDGDELLALQRQINPSIFKKIGKVFGMKENSSFISGLDSDLAAAIVDAAPEG